MGLLGGMLSASLHGSSHMCGWGGDAPAALFARLPPRVRNEVATLLLTTPQIKVGSEVADQGARGKGRR